MAIATSAPHALDNEQRARVKSWASGYKSMRPYIKQLSQQWANCRDWHLARGIRRYDWEAVFRIWMRRQVEIDSGAYTERKELPREPKTKDTADIISIDQAMKEFK